MSQEILGERLDRQDEAGHLRPWRDLLPGSRSLDREQDRKPKCQDDQRQEQLRSACVRQVPPVEAADQAGSACEDEQPHQGRDVREVIEGKAPQPGPNAAGGAEQRNDTQVHRAAARDGAQANENAAAE